MVEKLDSATGEPMRLLSIPWTPDLSSTSPDALCAPEADHLPSASHQPQVDGLDPRRDIAQNTVFFVFFFFNRK